MHAHTLPLAPSDYDTVTFPNRNILLLRGGSYRHTEIQFPVQIAVDDDVEPEETFFITYIPEKNALVIPPATEVKICTGT